MPLQTLEFIELASHLLRDRVQNIVTHGGSTASSTCLQAFKAQCSGVTLTVHGASTHLK